MATHMGLHVRVIRRGIGQDAAFIVQRRNPATLQWRDVQSFSEMADYASTDSHRAAWSLAGALGVDGLGKPWPSE